MPLLDIEQETKEFEKLLNNNFFSHDRSVNNAEDYDQKVNRDTDAVKRFVNSSIFDDICNQL